MAGDPEYESVVAKLRQKLHSELVDLEDPRAIDSDAATKYFDAFEYLGNGPRHRSWKKKKKAKSR